MCDTYKAPKRLISPRKGVGLCQSRRGVKSACSVEAGSRTEYKFKYFRQRVTDPGFVLSKEIPGEKYTTVDNIWGHFLISALIFIIYITYFSEL